MYTSGQNLTVDIKDNLARKTCLYMDSSPADDGNYKVIIFTDNVDLWKDYLDVTINVDLPLPPIPADYDRRTLGYDILAEMLKFICDLIRPSFSCRRTHLFIYNTGNVERPQAHIIFSPTNIENHESVLLKTTTRSELNRWHHFSNATTPDGSSSSRGSSELSSSLPSSSLYIDYSSSSISQSLSSTSQSSEGYGSVSVASGSASDNSVDEGAGQASDAPAMAVQPDVDPSTNIPIPSIMVPQLTISLEEDSDDDVEISSTSMALITTASPSKKTPIDREEEER